MTIPSDAVHAADPLAALRAATAERHERLDSGLPLGRPDASLVDYVAHLRLLRAWLAPLAGWFAGFHDGPHCDVAARLALIDADLRDAGADPAGTAAAWTARTAWPPEASAAWRWGVCYVIEGSQLGGAMLYGRLRERLAPHPLRYLKGADAGPGPGWRAFMQALREHVRGEGQTAEACAGACAAFDAILALR